MSFSRYDLKTVAKVIGTTATSLSLGAVPAGMKRWVTFLSVENKYGGEQTFYVASLGTDVTASTATNASAYAKTRFLLQGKQKDRIPRSAPAPAERPLFSIAASQYVGAYATQGDVYFFMQYFDAPV